MRPDKYDIEKPEVCRVCGGECCKRMPGSSIPSDFAEPLEESVFQALMSGRWALDWWEGDPLDEGDLSICYYLRPKIAGHDELEHGAWMGDKPCSWWTEEGCLEPLENRPWACRIMAPRFNENGDPECDLPEEFPTPKEYSALLWRPHQDAIKRALGRAKKERGDT